MSQSPYAPTPYETGYDPAGEPTRTSVMAILSIVFSLICILPGTGVVGILLGVGALVAIGRSNGRLEGKGAALSGVILGLITTVLWAAVGFGLLQGYTFYTSRMVPSGERFFMALSAGDLDAARAELTVDANEDVTDERLMLFAQEIESRIGSVQGAADSWNSMGQSFGRVFGGGGSGQPPQTNVSVQNQDAVAPIGILGDADSMIAWLVFDEQTLTGGPKVSPKIRDAFVQFENQDIVTLRAGGPGQSAAGRLGQGQVVEPGEGEDEAGPEPEPESGEGESEQAEPEEEPAEAAPM